MKARVLIVEDEPVVRMHLRKLLEELDYEVVAGVDTADAAVAAAAEHQPDLVLMDISLRGDGDGVDAARRLGARSDASVVFLTAFADEETVRRTEAVGALGYIVKPFSTNELRAVLATASALRARFASASPPPPDAAPAAAYAGMVGESGVMRDVFARIEEVASLDWPVLIEGETGTGKELTARALHDRSGRQGPFIAVNCAGITESLLTSQLFGHRKGAFTGADQDRQGFFEAAHGGTLFLDEIADVSGGVQRALLRVLEDGAVQRVGDVDTHAVNVRVVSATQRDLADEVAAGRFRADLMYRLRAVRLPLPPLRERGEDVLRLAEAFLVRAAAHAGREVRGFSAAAAAALRSYPWPGNVRELRNAVDQAVLACRTGRVEPAHLPIEISGAAVAVDERQRVLQALAAAGGNRTEAARILGISRATLYRRFEELGIEP